MACELRMMTMRISDQFSHTEKNSSHLLIIGGRKFGNGDRAMVTETSAHPVPGGNFQRRFTPSRFDALGECHSFCRFQVRVLGRAQIAERVTDLPFEN